jgi:dienelactone hydrolase
MERTVSFAYTLVALGLAIVISGCGGGSPMVTPPPPVISVAVLAGTNSVMATGTVGVTATVTGDSSGKGVTWAVSCSAAQCGSVASNATADGSAATFNATYTAPSSPPPSDLTITVTATSAADKSKSGSAPIVVSAITMSMNIGGTGVTASTATTATVQVGSGNNVTMNVAVNNDPSNQGAKFTVSPTSQASSLTIQDAFDATYNAPSTPPASDLTVTVTATSVEDSTKSVTVTITVPSVSISLSSNPAPDPNGNINVEATGTVSITPTVVNDSSGKGVTWTLTCSPAPCGSIPAGPTLSGAAQTYTAPSTPPSADVQVTVTATSVADASAQASIQITVKAISVSVTANPQTVLFNTTSSVVATVSYDPAKKGVTWAIQDCGVTDCGSLSSNASASGQAITYNAPKNPPANDLSVVVVATSDSDPNQAGSTGIAVPAITVTIAICKDQSCSAPTWPSAIIPVGATAALNATPSVATVNNDSSAQVNVNWTLTQNGAACTAAVCGTVTPSTTASGTPTTYAAPATVPAGSATVTINATSATDITKSASATITLTAGTVKLIPAALQFSNLKISFRQPHPTQTLQETLTNTGASTLSITGQSTTGTNASLFSVSGPCQGNLTTDVTSGASCAIGVTFAPSKVGSFTAHLSITDDDVTSPQQVPLSGAAHTCFPPRCGAGAELRSALAQNQIASVPYTTGTSRVGTRVVHFVDANRPDPYLANSAQRELLVRFWYPATVGKTCTPAEYTSAGVWNYLAQIAKVAPFKVKTNSCQDAPVAAGSHPVVVFTHGYTGTFTDYTFLFEDLASRGYVVASVNHTYEATAAQFPDGRVVKSLVGTHFGPSLQLDTKTTSFAVAARIADLKSVLDELQRMNARRSAAFAGKLDLSRVALAGHSLGGMTALLGMEMEPRFKAALSIDGITPGALFGTTSKPTLMLFAGRDPWDQDTCRVWSKLQGPRLALSFEGSEHLTPSDAVWLAKGAVQTGSVGMEKTVEAIRNYIAVFLDANLNGNAPDRLLKGPSPDYPDVEVTTQTQQPCGKTQSAAH